MTDAPERIWRWFLPATGWVEWSNIEIASDNADEYVLASTIPAMIAEAVAAERMACAAIVDGYAENEWLKPASGWNEVEVDWWEIGGADHLAAAFAAIRARGQS